MYGAKAVRDLKPKTKKEKAKYIVVRQVLTVQEAALESFGIFNNPSEADKWISERPNPREYFSLVLQKIPKEI